MAKQIVSRGGQKILGALASGAGDPMLTKDATTKEVGQVPAIDTSNFLTTVLNPAYIIVGSAASFATPRLLTGDLNISDLGVASIPANRITNAQINAAAGISYSKLNLTNSITNADINTAAAITRTKIANGSANRVLINNGSGVFSDNAAITGNRALISDVNGLPTHSSVTSTTLSYLDATSSVQTQLNNRLSFSSAITPAEGDIIYYTGGVWTRLAIGTSGQVLLSNGTIPTWGTPLANGIPTGGTANQVLRKIDGTNYNTEWHTLLTADITDLTATAANINILAATTVTAVQFNYLTGATSNIQTQLSAKLDNSLAHNSIFVGNASNQAGQLAPSTDGYVLTLVGGSPQWQAATGGGSVNSVSGTANRITSTGGATPVIDIAATYVGQASITTLGTITTGTWNGTAIGATYGGTGQTIYTVGDILYASTTTALSKLAAGTNGYVLTSNGPGAAPSWQVGGSGSGWATVGTTLLTGAVLIDGDGNDLVFNNFPTLSLGANTEVYFDAPQFTFANGVINVEQSSTSSAGINIPHGVAPTTPNDGDFWSTTLGFYGRVNGTTVGPFLGGLSNGSATTASGNAVNLGGTMTGNVTISGSSAYDLSLTNLVNSNSYTSVQTLWQAGSGSTLRLAQDLVEITTGGGAMGLVFDGTVNNRVTFNIDRTGADATGDTYYRNSSGYLTRLPAGTNGYVLTMGASVPAWAAPNLTGAWLLASGGTLTGANTITSNTASWLNFNGTWTATANNQYHVQFGGTITTRSGFSGDVTNGYLFNPSFTAGAPSNTAYGVNIAPTFSGFSGSQAIALRVRGDSTSSLRLSQNGYADYDFTTGAVLSGDTGDLEINANANYGYTWAINGNRRLTINKDGLIAMGANGVATANTRLDVRGTGTTTNLIQRWADSSNTLRASIKDSGQFWVENQGDDVEGIVYGTSGSRRVFLSINSTSATTNLQGYNGATLQWKQGMASSAQTEFRSNFNLPYIIRNDGGDAGVTGVLQLSTGTVSNSIQPSTTATRTILSTLINYNNNVNSADIRSISIAGTHINTAYTTVWNSIADFRPTLNYTGGSTTFVGYNYDPTLTSVTGLTHYAFRSTSGNWVMQGSGTSLTLGGGATASELRFLEPSGSGSNYIGFKAPAMAGDTTYDLPNAYPAVSGYVLSSTTAGVMSWRTTDYTTVTHTTTTLNETATSGEKVILADAATAGGNITINLPAASGNTAKFHIKKIDSGSNTIIVDGNSGETIDGAATFTLTTQYQSITIVSNGSNWFII